MLLKIKAFTSHVQKILNDDIDSAARKAGRLAASDNTTRQVLDPPPAPLGLPSNKWKAQKMINSFNRKMLASQHMLLSDDLLTCFIINGSASCCTWTLG